MKYYSVYNQICATCLAVILAATALSASVPEEIALTDVTVTASRPMSAIGVSKIDIDSAALHRTIASSAADALAFNPSVFVKTTGRATLTTVALRGASPWHTYVDWNGLPLNSPMLGTTDFSLIPAGFIDRASIFYGGSSTSIASGGLGGAVSLTNSLSPLPDGFSGSYTQGVGSWTTLDEFLSLGYRGSRLSAMTRVSLQTSDNDFTFTNHDKKLNIYDENHQIIGQYYPKEKNHGAYRDLNLMQQIEHRPSERDLIAVDAWWTLSRRDIPLITVDYSDTRQYENRQLDNTLRATASWRHTHSQWRTLAQFGAIHSHSAYNYGMGNGSGEIHRINTARTTANTYLGRIVADYAPLNRLSLNLSIEGQHDHIHSYDRSSMITTAGNLYGRNQGCLGASVRWEPTSVAGISANVRQQLVGGQLAPTVASLLADWHPVSQLTLHSSVTRNSRMPSVTDLYLIPGGNPNLKAERSISVDLGASASLAGFDLTANGYFSRIDDMIQWLPSVKGFFSPSNVSRVNSYGAELTASRTITFATDWILTASANYSLTRSVDRTRSDNHADRSFGNQLPYVPKHTASLKARLQWHGWEADYRLNYYSKRYTMTAGQNSVNGSMPHYLMNDLTLGKRMPWRRCSIEVKLALNNLFDVDYQTVLSHPMPGFNFEAFVALTF